MSKEYEVTEQEIQIIFDEYWETQKTEKKYQPVDKPKGIVLGGQPGSGKSNATARIKQQNFGENVVEINGDEFRELHPKKEEIDKRFNEESVKYTAQIAGRMTQMAIDKAIEERLNIIVEGTFRTAETPIKTLTQFKKAGYETSVVIATTEPETSWHSTLERYDEMKMAGLAPRYTPKAGHDLTIDNLGNNANLVFQSGLADTFSVNNRQDELWNNKQDGLPSQAINQELNKTKLNVLNFENQNILSIINDKIEKQSISFKEKEASYTSYRNNFLEIQSKNIKIELVEPGRAYTGTIISIDQDKTVQQTKSGVAIIHETKNLPGIEDKDIGKTVNIDYSQGKEAVIEQKASGLERSKSLDAGAENTLEHDNDFGLED